MFRPKGIMEYQRNMNTKFKFNLTKVIPTADRKLIISRKYFSLWKVIIQHRKRKKCLIDKEKIFEERIAMFISHLRINNICLQNGHNSSDNLFDSFKPEASTKIRKGACSEIYQNRFKAQKSIINNQKALIAEQNDIINKLKSSTTALDEYCIPEQNKEYSRPSDNSSEKLKPLPKPVEHPLVKKMKDREEERKNRWCLLALRRKEKEKLLAEKLKKEEEEKRSLEEKQRKLRIQEKREREKMLKEMELKKKKEQEMCALLAVKANSFYKRLLCAKIISKWKKHLSHLEKLQTSCSYMYDQFTLRRNLMAWNNHVVATKDFLHVLATRLYESFILTNSIYQWKLKIQELRSREREITCWYDKEITRNIVKKWSSATYKSIRQKEFVLKSFIAIYDRILLLKAFGLWKRLPLILYLEREKEKRLREWENRVKSILPDYNMQLF